jgi:two-component system NarL family sensor kinase
MTFRTMNAMANLTPSMSASSKQERLQIILISLVGIISALALLILFAARLTAPGDGTQVILEVSRLFPEGLPVKRFIPAPDGLREGDIVVAIQGSSVNDLAREAFTGKWDNGAFLAKPTLDYAVLRDGKTQPVRVQLAPFPLAQALLEGWSLYFALFAAAAVGLALFVRRPRLWHAQLFFILTVTIAAATSMYTMGHQTSDLLRGWVIPFNAIVNLTLWFFALGVFLHFCMIFPRRHPALRRHPAVIMWVYLGPWLIYAGAMLLRLPAAATPAALLQLSAQAENILAPLYFPLILIALVTNYRQLSDQTERRQMLWILWGVLVGLGGSAILYAISFLFGIPIQPLLGLVGLFSIAIPLSFAIAILRERLFDIELIINRTLVYGALTAILAGIFAATIALSQRFFIALTGQQSDAATVLTTLVVVAAFEPLKNGLKTLVDKRFKEAPDPEKQLQAFAEQVESGIWELNAERSARRLLEVATKAYDATNGAITLIEDGNSRIVSTVGEWKDDANLSVAIEANGTRLGEVVLGKRRNGVEYSQKDLLSLQQAVEPIARELMTLRDSKP